MIILSRVSFIRLMKYCKHMRKIKFKKIELLAPAGSLEKLKVAIDFGADAVYIGGKEFSLRARANNFELSDIEEGVKYAHSKNAKVYVTCNVLPHNNEVEEGKLLNYLNKLEAIGVDAIIASSIYIIDTCVKNCKKMQVHVSTQASVLNSVALNGYQELGATRVVLAREASIEEIKAIKDKTNCEMEVFIHGGMCAGFSGRCMLSNHMVNRDANRGGCAHSCRWNYNIYNKDKKLNDDDTFFNLGSKDLCSVDYITRLIEIGVDSLKIEGRMKSEYYVATIVRAYRHLIDDYYKHHEVDIEEARKEINKAENRLTSHGFFAGKITVDEQLYDRDDHPSKEFVGVVLSVDKRSGNIIIKQRNFFTIYDKVEFFDKDNTVEWMIDKIYDQNGAVISAARHPEQEVMIVNKDLAKQIKPGYFMRLLLVDFK